MHRFTALSVMLLLAACGDHPAAPSASPSAALNTEKVRVVTGADVRPVDGIVEAVDEAQLAAQTTGRVTAIVHDVGSAVPAGAVLLRITGIEQQAGLRAAQSGVTSAQSAAAEADAQFERVRALYDEHIASKAQYEAALAARDRSAAAATAAQSTLSAARESVAYTEVRAPFAGIVGRRLVEVGETVAPGRPLVSLVSPKKLRVSFNIPASIVDAVRLADHAAVQTQHGAISLAHVTIYPEAGGDTGTFRARADLPASVDLAPGTPVRIDVPTHDATHLYVPDSAIVHRSEITEVYVVDAHGMATLRYVRVGRSDGERTEILSGLVADESIALDTAAAARQIAGQRP
jgi:RND family efflux transporter MFP subunit